MKLNCLSFRTSRKRKKDSARLLRRPSALAGSIAVLAASALSLAAGISASAANLYWDINGTVAGASGTGSAVGTWDGINPFWNDSAGTGAGAAWNAGDTAIFSAGSNATQAFTITVSGIQLIGGLMFEEGLITLSGGTLQMAANSNFDVASGLMAIVDSTVDGAFDLTKTGLGTLVLGGTNTYTGRTLIDAGTLSIASDANLGTSPGVATPDSIIFTGSSTLQFTGSGSPALQSNRGITIGATFTGTVQVVAPANTVTYGGIVTGAAGTTFKKTGAGTLDLSGNSTATFLGALNLDGGTLKLSGNGQMAGTSGVTIGNRGTLTLDNTATNLGDRIANGITSTGGTLNFTHAGATATNYAESTGALALNPGALTINGSQAAAGQTSAVTLDSIARVAGGTLLFSGTGAGVDTRNELLLTSIAGLPASGVLIPWAIVNDATGTSFAQHTGAGTTLKRYAGAVNTGAVSTWVAASNARPAADDTLNNAARSVNTITLDSTIDLLGTTLSADRIITMSGAGGGAFLQTGGISTITANGTSSYQFAFGANEALFHVLGTLDIGTGSTADTNLTGTGGLTKTGAGTLIVRGTSTITGTYRVNEGIYEGRIAGSFGATQPMHLNGGTLRLSADAAITFTPTITVNADSTIQVDRVTPAATATTHTVGTLSIGGGRVLSVNSNDITAGTGYGLTTGVLTLTGPATIDVANNGAGLATMTVAAPTGAFTLTKTGAGDLVTNSITTGFSGAVDIQAGRIGWSGASGTITEAQTFSGAGGLVKSGAVVVNLSGASTFTGGIAISAGTLGFTTVSGTGGSASSLGQGATAIAMSGGILNFNGSTNQSTDRAITATAGVTLAANGTGGAAITYNGTITTTGTNLSMTLDGSGDGFISGAFTPTTGTGDIVKNGTGLWTITSGANSTDDILNNAGTLTLSGTVGTVADDTISTGATTVLNLNSTGVLNGASAASSGLYARSGATININANEAYGVTTGLDFILLGDNAVGGGLLNMNIFTMTTPRLDLGQATSGFTGSVIGTGTLNVTTSINLYQGTVSANLAGAGAVLKAFGGTVTLSGDNSGLTGATAARVDSGTLILDYTTSNTDKLRALTGLDMRGGTLTLNGNASATTIQTVASLTLANGGANTIDVNNGFGQSITLNLGPITRTANTGTIRFELPATGFITTTTANNNATSTGILGGYATVTDGTGTYFARNDGSGPPGSIVAATMTTQNDASLWVTGDNITDTGTGYTGIADCININSLRFNAAGPSTVTVASGGVLAINSGGLLVTSNVTAGIPSILGGRLSSGSQELMFTHDGTQTLLVSSTISGNTTITKAGTGTVALTGVNNSTGAVTVRAGTLSTSGTGIGDGAAVTLADDQASTLQITGNETIGSVAGGNATVGQTVGTVAIGSNTLTLGNGAAYAGVFTGNGTIVKNGTANLNLSGVSGAGFTGSIIVNNGLLQISVSGTLDLTNVTLNKGSAFLLDKNGTTTTGAAVPDGMTITLNSADGTYSGATIVRGLNIRRDQASTQNETVGAITLNSGASYATLDSSIAAGITIIIADNVIRTPGNNATFNVRGSAMTQTANARGQLRIGTAGNQTAFIATMVGGGGALGTKTINIVPWAIAQETGAGVAITDTVMGNSLASYVTGVGFRALDLVTEYNTFATKATNNDNIRESLTANLTGLAGTTLNGLVLHNNTVAATAINVTGTGAGQTLAVTSGALLFTLNTAAVAGNYGMTLGGFDSGITVGGTNEYVIHVVNPDTATPTKALSATISSPLTSTADITKSGRGTLILSDTNTAGGNARKTTINEGTLQIADLDNIGGSTGSLVFAGGTLKLDAAFNVGTDDVSGRTIIYLQGGGTIDTNGLSPTFAGSLGSGSGTFTKAGAGNLTLGATTTLTGATVVSAGTLTLGAAQAIGTGALTVSGATTVLAMGSNTATVDSLTTSTAGVSITGASGVLTVNNSATLNAGSVAPVLAGTMNLIAPANVTITLSNASNAFTGYTHIQQGTVSVLNLANVGSSSGLGAPAAGDNAAIRLGNAATNGTLLIAAAGTGGTTDRPIWLTGVTGNGTIDNDSTAALTLNGDIKSVENGAKTITLQGATTGFANVLNGIIDQCVGTVAVTKAEAGTWVLANTASPSTYTGVNTITLGTLQVNRATGGLGDSTAVNAIDLNAGTLSLRNDGAGNNGSIIYGSASNATGYKVQLTTTGSTINVANLTANTGNTIVLGPLTQATAVARTLNVTGANGYTLTLASLGLNPGTGQTTTLNPTTSSILITGNVTNPMSGFGTANFDTITLDGTSTGNVISGTISDAVGGGFTPVLLGGYTIVTKSNTGTWTLDGTGSTYTGNTNINAGVLIAGTDTSLGNSLISFAGGTLNNQDENRTFANNVSMGGTGTLAGIGNFAFNGNLSETGGNRVLNINNTGITTFGDAATDTITLAENNQARILTLNVAFGTSAAIVNATIQDGTGTGADGLTKLGGGPLTIKASNTYTGATTLDNGTTTFTAAQSLAAATNSLIIGASAATTTAAIVDFDNVNATFGGALTMNINNAFASTIILDPTRTLTINGNVQIGATTPTVLNAVAALTIGGGGSLNVTTVAAGTFAVGGSTAGAGISQNSILDLTGLATTTINVSNTGTVRVNQPTGTNVAGNQSSLLLPTPAVALNTPVTTITAANFNVGDNSGNAAAAGQVNSVILGTGLTTLNVNALNVGTGGRDLGQINFAAGNGTIVLRAADGTSRAALNIGTGTATTGVGGGAGVTNNVTLTGHSADLLISTLNIGTQNRGIAYTSSFTFDTGTLDVTSLTAATRTAESGNGAGLARVTNVTVNLGGGNVSIANGIFQFGDAAGTYTVAGQSVSMNATLNISGGIVAIGATAGTAITMAALNNGTSTEAMAVNSTINISGGTTTLAGNIVKVGVSGTGTGATSVIAALNLINGTLDMGGFSIGSATQSVVFTGQAGTLRNLAELNGGGTFTKTTGGTLTLDGTTVYTGATALQDGTLIADGALNNRLGTASSLTLGNGTSVGVLQLGNAAGPSNQTVSALASSGTGTSNAIVAGNASFSTLTVNQSTNTQFEGNIGGTAANQNNLNVVKSGSGVLVVSGTGTGAWIGTTTVNAGKLFMDTKAAFAANTTSLTVGDGGEFAVRGTGLVANQVYGFGASVGNKITVGSGAGTAILGFRVDGTFNTQLKLLAGQTMTVAAGSIFQTAVYVDDAPTAGLGYVLIDGADNLSLHAGGGTFDFNPVVFNGGSFTYALSNVTLGGTVDRWVLTPTAQPALGDVWWRGDLTGLAQGVWSAALVGPDTNWDHQQASIGALDAQVPPDSGSIVHFSSDAAANLATTLGANMTIQELIFHSGATAISVDGNSGLYTLTLGNGTDASGITLQSGAPSVTITADVALAQAQSFNVNGTGGGTLTFSRGISGTGPLSMNGNGSSTGTIILSGADGIATYTGATNLVAGRLILNGAVNNRLPTTTALTMGNATLGAILQLGDAVNGASNQTIGSLDSGAATTNSVVGGGATVSTLTIVQGSAGTFNGVIGGAGTNENQIALVKQGVAQLTINGAHTYTGATTVNNGILQLGSSGGINGSASLTISANAGVTAAFDNNSRSTVLAGAITLGGADVAATPAILNTGGTGSITLGGNVTYDATNNPLGGSIAAPLDLGTASRTFTANNSATAVTDLTISGGVISTAASVGANGVGLVLDGAGSAGLITGPIALTNGTTDGASADLTKNGTGTWTIQNTATVGDDYLINAGILTISGSGSLTWNATGSASPDFVADTVAAPVVNFNVPNSIIGNVGTNRIFARDGSTVNLNATGAIGASVEQIILGDDNNGIGNLVLLAGTTNSVGRLDLGFNSAGEIGNVTGTGTLTVITNLNLRNGIVSANLDGAAATLKTDTLTATLSGNNSLTGTTVAEEGTLTLDYATIAGTNNKIGTGNFSIGSATHSDLRPIVNFVGNATTASRQDVGSFTVLGGPSQINLTGTLGVDNIFRITGPLARTGGTVNFSLANANTKLEYSGATTNTNGIVPAWMILNRSDFFTISENGTVDRLVAATYTTQNNAALWETNQNITNSAGFSGTVDPACNTINSLRFNAAGASTITVASGKTLIVSSGGIMATSAVGANASTITGGLVISGTGEFFFHQNNTASTLTIASRFFGSPAITKTGSGALVLSGTNNATGAVTIEEGIIRLTGGSALSDTSGVTIRNSGGTANTGIELLASQTETIGTLTANTTAASIILNTGSILTVLQGSAQTMAGVISGAGTFVKSGGSTLTLTGTSTMTGTVRVDQGQLLLSGNVSQFATATAIILNGPTSSIQNNQDQTAANNRLNGTVLLNNTAGGTGFAMSKSASTGNATETVGALTLGAGHNTITATSAIAATVGQTTFASLAARNNRATALVRGLGLGDSTATQRGQIVFTAAPSGANVAVGGGGAAASQNISIFPWLVGDATAASLGNSFVMNTGATNGLRPLTATEYTTDAAGFDALPAATLSNNNLRFATGATLTGTATGVNALVIDAATGQTVTGPGNPFEITSGAILAASTGTTITHSLDGFTAITTGGGRDYTTYVTSTTGTLTVVSPLTSTVPLVKSGAGTLSLTAAGTGNQFTDIYLNQGTVLADDLDRLGTGTLRFYGGGLKLTAGWTDDPSTKTWDINTGGGTLDVSLVTAGVTLANGIDDSTAGSADELNIFTRSSATGSIGQLTIQGASSFTGTTIVRNSGTTTVTNANGVVLNGTTDAAINGNLEIGDQVNVNNNFDAVVALGASNQIVDTATITFRGASGENAYLKLLGFNETVAGIIDTTANGVIENREGDTVSSSGTLTLNSSQDFSYNGFLRDVSTGLADANTLNLVKQGTGTQTLSGAQIRHSGTTTISGGALTLTDVTNWQSAITNNATLNLNQTSGSRIHGNTIAGSGTLVKFGAGTIVLGGSNSYSGVTDIEQGILSISASANLGDGSATNDIVIANGATLQSTGASVDLGVDRGIALAGASANIAVTGSNLLTIGGVISGDDCTPLFKTDTGTLIYTGANIYTATTNISAGVLQIGNGGTTGTLGSGAVLNSGTLTFNRSNLLTMANNISGTGSLNQSGTATGRAVLSGTNTYSGVTTVGTGTLQFASQVSLYNNTPADWTAVNLVINSGATAAFNVGGAGEFTSSDIDQIKLLGTAVGGFKSGSAIGFDTTNAGGTFAYGTGIADTNASANSIGVTKFGSGTLALGASNTYTGATNINAGTLAVVTGGSLSGTTGVTVNAGATLLLDNNVNNNVNPTTPASLTIAGGKVAVGPTVSTDTTKTQTFGALTLSGASTLDFGSGAKGNALVFAATANFTGGTLEIWNWSGSVYNLGDSDNGSLGDTQDRFLFNGTSGLSAGQLANIQFFSGAGTGAIGLGASEVSFVAGGQFEIVPVPEPATATLLGTVALCALIGYRGRRRFSGVHHRLARR